MGKIDFLFKQWFAEEREKLTSQKINNEETKAKRSYIHFDKRRSGSSLLNLSNKYRKIFTAPELIATTAFWPFLKITLEEIKIKNAKKGLRKKIIKKRDVYFAGHYDALVYSWYSFLLNNQYEPLLKFLGIEKNVIAYRKIPQDFNIQKNKCNIHFAKEVFNFIKNKNEDCVAFVADITGFFDNLDHEHLKTEWTRVLGLTAGEQFPADHEVIFKNLTRFKYVEVVKAYNAFDIKLKTEKIIKDDKTKVIRVPRIGDRRVKSILDEPLSRKDFVSRVVKKGLIKGNENWNNDKRCIRGIMQGSPISATLANIYMLSFDKVIADYVAIKGGIYRRYSDDIVVVCNTKDYEFLKNAVMDEIKRVFLVINPDKTDTTFFRKNENGILVGYGDKEKKMQYLGFEFNGHSTFIRPKSLTKYYRKMKTKIRKAISMAWGKKSKTKNNGNVVFKKALHEKFLRKGKRSFISYALRANEIMENNTIKKQVHNRGEIMQNYLAKKLAKRYKATP